MLHIITSYTTRLHSFLGVIINTLLLFIAPAYLPTIGPATPVAQLRLSGLSSDTVDTGGWIDGYNSIRHYWDWRLWLAFGWLKHHISSTWVDLSNVDLRFWFTDYIYDFRSFVYIMVVLIAVVIFLLVSWLISYFSSSPSNRVTLPTSNDLSVLNKVPFFIDLFSKQRGIVSINNVHDVDLDSDDVNFGEGVNRFVFQKSVGDDLVGDILDSREDVYLNIDTSNTGLKSEVISVLHTNHNPDKHPIFSNSLNLSFQPDGTFDSENVPVKLLDKENIMAVYDSQSQGLDTETKTVIEESYMESEDEHSSEENNGCLLDYILESNLNVARQDTPQPITMEEQRSERNSTLELTSSEPQTEEHVNLNVSNSKNSVPPIHIIKEDVNTSLQFMDRQNASITKSRNIVSDLDPIPNKPGLLKTPSNYVLKSSNYIVPVTTEFSDSGSVFSIDFKDSNFRASSPVESIISVEGTFT